MTNELIDDVERVVIYVDGEKHTDLMSKISKMQVVVEESATRQVREK